MNDQPPQQRTARMVTNEQEKILRIFESLHFAVIENIKIRDGRMQHMEIRISIDMNDPESFRKAIDELKTIVL